MLASSTRRLLSSAVAARTLLRMGAGLGRTVAATAVSMASLTCSASASAPALSTPASEPHRFVGPYASTRAVLDYTYHQRPSVERQALQDLIVSKALGYVDDDGNAIQPFDPPRLAQPWLLYTSGAMGAGKSRCLRYLHSSGAFPLESFVIVDPDKLKEQLPELPMLLKESPQKAHTTLHRESGYLAEIIEREAMLSGRSVIVDGSLRDVTHYAKEIGRTRAEFPSYKIGILWVRASNETVYRRAEKRERITGRHVPKEVLDSALRQVPTSFAVLSGLVDYAGIVDNDWDDRDPVFAHPHSVEEFSALWRQTPPKVAPPLLASKAAVMIDAQSAEPIHVARSAAEEAAGSYGGAEAAAAECASVAAAASASSPVAAAAGSAEQQQQQWALFPGGTADTADAAKAAAEALKEQASGKRQTP